MRSSLRRGLLISLLLSSGLIWGITTYRSYQETRYEIAKLFDAELSQSARVLMALVKNSVVDGGIMPKQWKRNQLVWELGGYLPGNRYEQKLAFQLWTDKGRLVMRTSSAPLTPLSDINHGFSRIDLDGHSWHVFSLPDHEGKLIARVAQQDDIRTELIDDIAWEHIKQVVWGFPLLTFVVWIIVGRSLSPVRKLTQNVEDQDATRLILLEEKGIPYELQPLVQANNRLLGRVKQAIESERRFTADAAHELRTPLAGIKTQAQLARKTKDDEIRENALVSMDEAVDQLTHTVYQLLTLARLDPKSEIPDCGSVNLIERVTRIVSDLEPMAFKKHIELSMEQTDRSIIHANATTLDILLRNLIDNAVRYTPQGGQIKIRVEKKNDETVFLIDDNGPGIPDSLKDKVFHRFYRNLDATGQAFGCGLGLSIVERIVKLHNADIELDDSIYGGLRVKVTFANQDTGE